MLAHYEGAGEAPDGEWMARLKLVLAPPAIRGEYLKINCPSGGYEMQEALAEAIATRTGTDIGQDMYPRILAGAVIAAAQVAVRRWAAWRRSRSGGGPPGAGRGQAVGRRRPAGAARAAAAASARAVGDGLLHGLLWGAGR